MVLCVPGDCYCAAASVYFDMVQFRHAFEDYRERLYAGLGWGGRQVHSRRGNQIGNSKRDRNRPITARKFTPQILKPNLLPKEDNPPTPRRPSPAVQIQRTINIPQKINPFPKTRLFQFSRIQAPTPTRTPNPQPQQPSLLP
jgi:hypothetical protein